MIPVTKGLVTGGGGYLTDKDLEVLDQYVDSYVNGNFYKSKLVGEGIVNGLVVSAS